jgi:hypothetical protein
MLLGRARPRQYRTVAAERGATVVLTACVNVPSGRAARVGGGAALGPGVLAGLRGRYDQAISTGEHPQPAKRLGQRQPPRLRHRLLAAGTTKSRSSCTPATSP